MKRIRLTEGQLYGLIRKVLNEEAYKGGLDWKTLYNASDKAHQRGDQTRMYKFGDAARDAFQKKHKTNRRGTSLIKGGTINDENPVSSQTDIGYQMNVAKNEYEPHVSSKVRAYDKDEWDKWRGNAKKETDKYGYSTSTPKGLKTRYTANGKDYGDSNIETPEFNDVYNFSSGRSKYTKGKGWNESLARRVTESIVRKLNEGWSTSFNLANYGSSSNYNMPQSLQDIVDYYGGENADGSPDNEITNDIISALEKLPRDQKSRCIEELYEKWGDPKAYLVLPRTFEDTMQDLALYPNELINSLDDWASVVAVPVYNTLVNDYGYGSKKYSYTPKTVEKFNTHRYL